jgi:hypothetical protein
MVSPSPRYAGWPYHREFALMISGSLAYHVPLSIANLMHTCAPMTELTNLP